MNKILAMREKRGEVWDKAKAFLNEHQDENGMLSPEDAAQYERMEQEVVDIGHAIEREERAAQMRERIGEGLAAYALELEEGRFLQEVAILADRLDVSEELTRLQTHLERLHELLDDGRDAGRRLDFTLQECFREINTCGNKLPDVQLSRMVVDFKNELEKCREQVQNLE